MVILKERNSDLHVLGCLWTNFFQTWCDDTLIDLTDRYILIPV